MALFNFFKRQEDASPAKDDLLRAKEFFTKGEYQECLRTLIGGFRIDVNYKPLYELAAECLGKLDAYDERKLFDAVCKNPGDATAYTNLGTFYFNVGHYDLAQVFFEKTLQLNPGNTEVPHDLAICYARRFQVSKAIEVLATTNLNDFWNLYFYNKCKILGRQLDGVQESLNDLQAFLDLQPDADELVVPKMKIAELQETLQRYTTVNNIQMHIRDWQYIQYGGVVLDYFDDTDDYVAGGRYVASWGSNDSIKSLAVKLKQFAERLAVPVQSVVSLEDRDSEIVGRVLALELGVPFGFYDPATTNVNCLVVSADTSRFNDHEELSLVTGNEILFAANHSWLDHAVISPDIVGFMTQTYSFPWSGGGMRVTDPRSGTIERIPPDNRSAEEIATSIYSIPHEPEDISRHLAFYAAHRDYLKGIGKLAGEERYNFMVESPVPGAYFG